MRTHYTLPRQGFTLIELLIVMVVLGILFIIGLFLFNDVRDTSHNSAAKAKARAALVKSTSGYVNNGRSFGTDDADAVSKMPSGESLTYVTDSADFDDPNEIYVQLDDGINDLPSAGSDHAPVGKQLTVCSLSETGMTYCIRSNQDGTLATAWNDPASSTLLVAAGPESSTAYSKAPTVSDAVCNLPTPSQAPVAGLCEGSPAWNGPNTDAGGDLFAWGYVAGPADVIANVYQSGSTVSAVGVGFNRFCAVVDKQLMCRGDNTYGGIGNGTTGGTVSTLTATSQGDLPNNPRLTKVSSSAHTSCAIAGGDAYCWGYNGNGGSGNQAGVVGDGTSTNRSVPTAVSQGAMPANASVSKISVGDRVVCAIANGSLYCWGTSDTGELGQGTGSNQSSYTPVAVTGGDLPGGAVFTDVAVGGQHVCAVANSRIYCWGGDGFGQLGNGAITGTQDAPRLIGGAIAGLTATHVAVGNATSCAVAEGNIYCWGFNGNGIVGNTSGGMLGNGGWANSNTPVAANMTPFGGAAITKLAAGSYEVCAIAGGAAYCWGQNSSGQLGDGTISPKALPTALNTTEGLAGRTLIDIDVDNMGGLAIASPN